MPLNITLPAELVQPHEDESDTSRVAAALQKVWTVSMQDEADFLHSVVFGTPKILDFKDHKELVRFRMRLYRCKRMLQAVGNRYVNRLTFRQLSTTTLQVEIAESIMKFVREEEG